MIFSIFARRLFSALALATSFMAQPFPSTVKDAPNIVRGRVKATHSDYGHTEDTGKRIYTYTDLQLDEVLKGSGISGPVMILREIGGEKDGVGLQVAGASHFAPGEEVVVMLGPRNSDETYDIRGLMMGKLNIKRDESGKMFLEGPALNEDPESTGGPTPRRIPLAELRSIVASQAAGSEPPAPAASMRTSAAPRLQPVPQQASPAVSASAAPTAGDGPAGGASPVSGIVVLVLLAAGGLLGWVILRRLG